MKEKWRFKYKGEKIKLFILGKNFGVSGWISIPGQKVNLKGSFYIAMHKEFKNKIKIQQWGNENCEVFEELSVYDFPKNWHLFKIKEVKNCKAIEKDIPALSIYEMPRYL